MWKLLKYEFRRARTSLLTVLGVHLRPRCGKLCE